MHFNIHSIKENAILIDHTERALMGDCHDLFAKILQVLYTRRGSFLDLVNLSMSGLRMHFFDCFVFMPGNWRSDNAVRVWFGLARFGNPLSVCRPSRFIAA